MTKKEKKEPVLDPDLLSKLQKSSELGVEYASEGDGTVALDFAAIELEKLRGELKAAKEEVATVKDQYVRAYAEIENVKRRSYKDIAESRKFAVTAIVKDLVDVIESLYRSTEHVSEEDKKNDTIAKIVEGIELTRNELMTVLSKNNVKRVDPKVGDLFDHNFHQALSYVNDTNYPKNAIVKVIQAGYLIEDRLIKPALVLVSAGQ